MGISKDFENIAKQIQECASTQRQTGEIHDMVLQIENICAQACCELEQELERIKHNHT